MSTTSTKQDSFEKHATNSSLPPNFWKYLAIALGILSLLLIVATIGAIYVAVGQQGEINQISFAKKGAIVRGDYVVATGDVYQAYHLQDLPKATLHQLSSIHTIILPAIVKNSTAIGGKIIHISEVDLDPVTSSVLITSDAGEKYRVTSSGIVQVSNQKILARWSPTKRHAMVPRQTTNSTELVYANTFVPFDSSF